MKGEGMDKVREALAELVAATDPRGDTPVEGWKSAWRKAREALCAQPAEPVAAFSEAVVLPDGSAFAVASFPLPKDHWLYAPRGGWDSERDEYAECPHPILNNAQRDAVREAIRYAVRGATMCGQEKDFDPDALVLNACYALCGPTTGAVLPADAQPAPSVPAVPDGWQLVRDTTSEERSWPDDASHENGRYFNTCVHCLRGFIGHKRRVVCRVCAAPHPAVTEEMVNRFLGWRLPEDFYPDGGVSFAREVNGGPRPRDWWPTGTNLLTAEQARAMLAHVIAAAPYQAAKGEPT